MIIATSGTGFTGGNIVKSLNDKGVTDILVVDSLEDGTKFINLVDLDIAGYVGGEDSLIQTIAEEDFDGIETTFHEGAYSSTTEWSGKYMMDSNHQCSKGLLHYCLERETPFLYVSSAATYDGRTSNFIESREYEKPLNIYGYSKFLSDGYTYQILPEANSQIVGSRYFNIYGPREDHEGSVTSVAFHLDTQFNNGETPEPSEDNEDFKRGFVYVGDVATVNLWFLESGVSGIFNLSTGHAGSFQVVADATLVYHKKNSIEYIPFPEKLESRYQAPTQADLVNLHMADCDKPFRIIIEGTTEYMTWLNRDT